MSRRQFSFRGPAKRPTGTTEDPQGQPWGFSAFVGRKWVKLRARSLQQPLLGDWTAASTLESEQPRLMTPGFVTARILLTRRRKFGYTVVDDVRLRP